MLHLRHSATNDYVVIMFMMQQLGINLLELFLSFIPLIFLLFLLFVLLSLSACKAIVSSLQYWFVVLGDLATCSNTMSVSSCAFAYLTAWDSFSTECWYNLSGALTLPAFTLLQTAMTLQRPRSSASLRTPAYTRTHTHKHSLLYCLRGGVIRFTVLVSALSPSSGGNWHGNNIP